MPIIASITHHPPGATLLVETTASSKRDSHSDAIIDVIALTIAFVLVAGLVVLGVYAWRRRCDGRKNACAACRRRQGSSLSVRDDDLEDLDFVWDGKDVVGKQD